MSQTNLVLSTNWQSELAILLDDSISAPLIHLFLHRLLLLSSSCSLFDFSFVSQCEHALISTYYHLMFTYDLFIYNLFLYLSLDLIMVNNTWKYQLKNSRSKQLLKFEFLVIESMGWSSPLFKLPWTLPCSAQHISHLFIQDIHTVYTTHSVVT